MPMAHRTSEPIARPFCVLALVALALLASPASASTHHSSFINQLTNQPTSQPTNRPSTQLAADHELATTYAPILSFHERERYRPQSIDVMLDHARLRQTVAGVEVTVLDKVTAGDLATAPAAWRFNTGCSTTTTTGTTSTRAIGRWCRSSLTPQASRRARFMRSITAAHFDRGAPSAKRARTHAPTSHSD